SRVQRVDVGSPAREPSQPLGPWHAGIGNVVNAPAKGIDLEHRFALDARQYPHRGVERAARRTIRGATFGRARICDGASHGLLFMGDANANRWRSEHPANEAARYGDHGYGGDAGLCQMDPLTERVADLQQADQPPGERLNHGDFESKPRVAYPSRQ